MFWSSSTSIREWLPRLQAHRGYWVGGLQQNSLKSVQEAYRLGYKIAEFDVRLTNDQVAVLFHDEQYQNKKLSQSAFQDFKALIAPEFPDLPKLEDVFDWMRSEKKRNPDFDFKLNIEIKSNKIWNGNLEKEIFKLIKKFDLEKSILISSFNPFTLFRIKKIDSKIWRALLMTHGEESNFLLNSMILNFLARPHVLHLRWNDLNQSLLNRVNEKVPVVLWTVNDLSLIKEFQGQIFGVISDRITPQEIKTKAD